jgi:iron complex outermembrane receptor protein
MPHYQPSLSRIAAAVAALAAAGASAQGTGSTTLQQVTVTGDSRGSYSSRLVQVGAFRDLDPLDVPLTNNVVTREVLDAQGTNTLFGALRNTAGVTRSQLTGSTYDNISIRGLLVENRGNYRLNGFLPVVNLISIPLENKERVEVLKGASSLYYGFVPPSGIVNFVAKRAGSTPVTSVATSINDGAADIHADIGRRFGVDDSMGVRINAVAGKEDIGIERFSGDRGLFSIAYDWRVSPTIGVKADLEHYRKDVSEQAAIQVPQIAGRAVVPRLPDNRTNAAGEWQRYDAEATNALLRGDVSLAADWTLTLETGYAMSKRDRRYSFFRYSDLATGEGTLNIFFANGQRYENTSHRADLNGRFTTAGLVHELTVGGMYNRRESYGGASAPTATQSQNIHAPRPVPERNPVIATRGSSTDIVDKGIYIFDRLLFNKQWHTMVGLRYSDYTSTNITASGVRSPYSTTDVSPSVSVIYKPLENVSVYASYLEGLEETGTAGTTHANAGEALSPAVNKQRELGIKWRTATGALLQGALFDIRRPQTTVDASNRFVVGGNSEYRGLELSASGELSRDWSVIASALLLDATITRSSNAREVGRIPENTPRRTFSLFGEYRIAQVPGWSINAGAYHVGKRPVNNANDAFVGSYTLYSIGTRYRTKFAGHDVTLQANVENATNRDYWATAGNNLLGAGSPRTLRLAAKFEL